jgi:hypothetical protein
MRLHQFYCYCCAPVRVSPQCFMKAFFLSPVFYSGDFSIIRTTNLRNVGCFLYRFHQRFCAPISCSSFLATLTSRTAPNRRAVRATALRVTNIFDFTVSPILSWIRNRTDLIFLSCLTYFHLSRFWFAYLGDFPFIANHFLITCLFYTTLFSLSRDLNFLFFLY